MTCAFASDGAIATSSEPRSNTGTTGTTCTLTLQQRPTRLSVHESHSTITAHGISGVHHLTLSFAHNSPGPDHRVTNLTVARRSHSEAHVPHALAQSPREQQQQTADNITASQHHSITASQHHSITASQHHSITVSQHHSITASHHHTITPSQHPAQSRTQTQHARKHFAHTRWIAASSGGRFT